MLSIIVNTMQYLFIVYTKLSVMHAGVLRKNITRSSINLENACQIWCVAFEAMMDDITS